MAKKLTDTEIDQRPLPNPADIVAQSFLTLPETCICGGQLVKLDDAIRYLEDISLPELTLNYKLRLITENHIGRARCLDCKQITVAANYNLSGQVVQLGDNVKLLVCVLIAAGLTYSQVVKLLKALYGLQISSGEIANILWQKHLEWQPFYKQLWVTIRGSPWVHADETRWLIRNLNRAGWLWVLSAKNGPTLYVAKESRRLVHALDLLEDFVGIRITDNYAAYSNWQLKGKHQLCWAHLFRTIRDLHGNSSLPADQFGHVDKFFVGFSQLYSDLRKALAQPTTKAQRLQQAAEMQTRLDQIINKLPGVAGEPRKLIRFKNQLRKAAEANKLFVCLPEYAPCDNNRAQRDLRQFVIKRKNSFGSVSLKGATALATIMTVCTNAYREHPNNYFKALAEIG